MIMTVVTPITAMTATMTAAWWIANPVSEMAVNGSDVVGPMTLVLATNTTKVLRIVRVVDRHGLFPFMQGRGKRNIFRSCDCCHRHAPEQVY